MYEVTRITLRKKELEAVVRNATKCSRATTVFATSDGDGREIAVVKAEKEVCGIALSIWLLIPPGTKSQCFAHRLEFEGSEQSLVEYCVSRNKCMERLPRSMIWISPREEELPYIANLIISSAIVPDFTKPSAFLALPQELRSTILELALSDAVVLHYMQPEVRKAWIVCQDPQHGIAPLNVSKGIHCQFKEAACQLAQSSPRRRVLVYDLRTDDIVHDDIMDQISICCASSGLEQLDIVLVIASISDMDSYIDTFLPATPAHRSKCAVHIVIDSRDHPPKNHMKRLRNIEEVKLCSVYRLQSLNLVTAQRTATGFDRLDVYNGEALVAKSTFRCWNMASLLCAVLDVDTSGQRTVQELLCEYDVSADISISEAAVLDAMLPRQPLFAEVNL